MAHCLTAPSHYMNQCWPSSMTPYDITGPQWVCLYIFFNFQCTIHKSPVERWNGHDDCCSGIYTFQITVIAIIMTSHECHGISTHQQLNCLFYRLFRLTTENTSTLYFTGLTVTDGLHSQNASNVKSISMFGYNHGYTGMRYARVGYSLYEGYYICSAISTPLFQVSGQGSTLSFLAGCPKSHFLDWYTKFLVYWYLKLDNQVVNSTCPKDKLGWIWRADAP